MAFAQMGSLEPELAGAATALVVAAHNAGLMPRLTSARRTSGQQARLYRRFLEGNSQLPALPPGLSAHEYGLAFDLVTSPFEALGDVGATWQSWGGEWGGSGDPVHFQYPGSEEIIKKLLQDDPVAIKALGLGIDIAIGFIPVVGSVETAATILQLFPSWAHSPVVDFLSGPGSYILHRLR
jgi:hypothetical protein